MAPGSVVFGLTVPMSLSLLGHRMAALADLGWRVHVVIGEPVPPEYTPDPRVTVHLIPTSREVSPIADARCLREWTRLLKSLSPTMVIGATPKAAFIAMLAARRAHVPIRVLESWGARWDGDSGPRALLVRQADRLAARCATVTIAVSDSLADLLVSSGVCRQRPTVLGFGGTKGVDLARFTPATQERTGPPVVGFVGRLAADKGINDLRTVMELVRTTVPDARLEYAGAQDSADPIDPATSGWLHHDLRNHGVGQVVDVPGYLQGIDVMCFPSHREGLPNAVIEAAACAVPVVAWDVTGVRDAVADGVTGYLVAPGDHAAMAARVLQLLQDPDLRSTMGAAARARAAERFDAVAVQRAFIAFITGLVPG